MKKVIVLFGFILITGTSFSLHAQNTYAATITEQAGKMLQAFVDADYETLINYTYPGIVDMLGGHDGAVELTKMAMDGVYAGGGVLDSVYLGEPGNVVETGKELHSSITQFVVMTMPGVTIKSASTLMAVSSDNGEHWTFLDIKQLTPELQAILFPDYNEALILPEAPPVEYMYVDSDGNE